MARTKKMLLLAENITAEEALAGGFLVEIVPPADVDRRIAELTDRLVHHAPITMRVTKEAMRRLLHAGFLNGDDLVRQAFGSEDFREGVAAFVAKREPQWRGK
jgi:enoyl-CoA hydratase/carnithine racemase